MLPDSVVVMLTLPTIQPVPVPFMTRSVVLSTAPVAASTSTVRRLAPSAPTPFTVVSYASFAPPSRV